MAFGASSGASVDDETIESGVAYRPHLDGLRAVAVYLVVLFHAGSSAFPGGFIGVDVFFVLSGFLVTQLLLRDIARTGSIGLRRFYARRFRRLLPAAFVALTVTAVVYTAIASPVEVSAAVPSFKAAFLYSTNWHLIHQAAAYFGADINTNPVLHFWSLAVEEQFYLLWPLTLGGLYALTRRIDPARRLHVIRTIVAVGALASAIWALSLRNSNPNRAYYGTDTRAYELLAGAFIALVPTLIATAKQHRRTMRIATAFGAAAVLVLASSWVDVDAIERGIAVTITTCVLIVAVEAAEGGLVRRTLSTRTMVYLGKISYGTYLWHWLVILVLLRAFRPSPVATVGIGALVATALASLSFEMLERPVRMSRFFDRYPRAVITAGLAISVVSALVLIPKIATPSNASAAARHSTEPSFLTPVPAGLEARALEGHFPQCIKRRGFICTIRNGTGLRFLLLGDSNAATLTPMLADISDREGLALYSSVQAGCPWQRDLYTRFYLDNCRRLKESLYGGAISELRPDVVVVMNVAYGGDNRNTPPLLGPNRKPVGFSAVARATRRSVALLRAKGREVLLVEPFPVPTAPNASFDPFICLHDASVLEQCRYTANPSPSPIERLYRGLAKEDHRIYSLDLDRDVCPLLPICDPVIGGVIVKMNATHITTQYSHALGPRVDIELRSDAILPLRPLGSR
jgi:peptidoglycan/LPS O-acetylase OafA/YrhL